MNSNDEREESHQRVVIERIIKEYITSKFGDLDARLLEQPEVAKVRTLLEQDARTQWLWSTARTWLLFVAAAVTGVTLGIDALKAVLKRLIT